MRCGSSRKQLCGFTQFLWLPTVFGVFIVRLRLFAILLERIDTSGFAKDNKYLYPMIQSLFFQTSWRTQQLGRFLANISCCRIQNTALLKRTTTKYIHIQKEWPSLMMVCFDDSIPPQSTRDDGYKSQNLVNHQFSDYLVYGYLICCLLYFSHTYRRNLNDFTWRFIK